jgi:hypothetical protein
VVLLGYVDSVVTAGTVYHVVRVHAKEDLPTVGGEGSDVHGHRWLQEPPGADLVI